MNIEDAKAAFAQGGQWLKQVQQQASGGMTLADLVNLDLVQMKDTHGNPIGWGSVVRDDVAGHFGVVVPYEGDAYLAYVRLDKTGAVMSYDPLMLAGPLYCGRAFTATGAKARSWQRQPYLRESRGVIIEKH